MVDTETGLNGMTYAEFREHEEAQRKLVEDAAARRRQSVLVQNPPVATRKPK